MSAGKCKDCDSNDLTIETEDDDTADDGALRTGMDLGFLLFGAFQSYRDQMEEEFDKRLRRVKGELEEI